MESIRIEDLTIVGSGVLACCPWNLILPTTICCESSLSVSVCEKPTEKHTTRPLVFEATQGFRRAHSLFIHLLGSALLAAKSLAKQIQTPFMIETAQRKFSSRACSLHPLLPICTACCKDIVKTRHQAAYVLRQRKEHRALGTVNLPLEHPGRRSRINSPPCAIAYAELSGRDMKRIDRTLRLCIGGVLLLFSGLIIGLPKQYLAGKQSQEAPSSAASDKTKQVETDDGFPASTGGPTLPNRVTATSPPA